MGSNNAESPKSEWVDELPSGPPEKMELARILEDAPVDDCEFEMSNYQRAADPIFETVETQQRRFRGQFRRRLKRLSAESRDHKAT